MEQKQTKKLELRSVLKAACHAAGTFFYVFFMMAPMIVFITGLRSGYWMMPLFVVPSSLVCLTLGADYWVGESPTRSRSNWISNIVSAVTIVPICIYSMPANDKSTMFRIIAAVLLPACTTLYGTIKANRRKALLRQVNAGEKAEQPDTALTPLRKATRTVCLLGISCVLLENTHRAVMNGYHLITMPDIFIMLPGLITFPLSILSAILLARLVKAEFVRRDSSFDLGAYENLDKSDYLDSNTGSFVICGVYCFLDLSPKHRRFSRFGRISLKRGVDRSFWAK